MEPSYPHEHIKHPFTNISGTVLTETNWKLEERLVQPGL